MYRAAAEAGWAVTRRAVSFRVLVFDREIVDSHLFDLRARSVISWSLFVRASRDLTASFETLGQQITLLLQFLLELFSFDLPGLDNLFIADKLPIICVFLRLQVEIKFFLVFFQIIDFLLQNFDVEFQLLFNLDVIAHLSLVLLELLLVLLRWEVDRLERGAEVGFSTFFTTKTVMFVLGLIIRRFLLVF